MSEISLKLKRLLVVIVNPETEMTGMTKRCLDVCKNVRIKFKMSVYMTERLISL